MYCKVPLLKHIYLNHPAIYGTARHHGIFFVSSNAVIHHLIFIVVIFPKTNSHSFYLAV